MIIQCPACTTRYAVPDTAIGVDGRTVRCAKCRHSWFQDGPELVVPDGSAAGVMPPSPPPPSGTAPSEPSATPHSDPERVAAPQPADDAWGAPDPEPVAPIAEEEEERDEPPIGPSPESLRDEIRPPRARPDGNESGDFGDPPPSPFDYEPPFRPRRNPLKVWSWAAGIFAVVAAGLIFAVSYWGLPAWVPVERPTFAVGNPDLQLDFPREQQERRTLPNGTEFFGATGTITNIGTQAHTIPSILIVLRDARDRKVYEWVVPPPQRTLAPGETVPVSEAVTDIPRSAREVQFGWKPE